MTDIDNLRPASIDRIKRLADRLQARHGIPRSQALDGAAQRRGFNNYVHATRALTDDAKRVLSAARRRRDSARQRDEYRARTRREWSEAVEAVATDPSSTVWTQPYAIMDAIAPSWARVATTGSSRRAAATISLPSGRRRRPAASNYRWENSPTSYGRTA